MMPATESGRKRRTLAGVLGTVAVVYAILCAFMYLRQDDLVFFPQPERQPPATAAGRKVEPLELGTSDGVRLRGWFLGAAASSASGRSPLLVYFSGNAEEVSYLVGEARWPEEWAVVFFNYRGYGASEGVPSEARLLADATLIFDAAIARADVDPQRVAVMGRSLGTGVATFVAAARRVSCVILVSPYDSLVNVASAHYPWLPVSALLKHRFDSGARANAIGAPMLAIVAPGDSTVPVERSLALVERWRGPTRVERIVEASHGNFGRFEAYWRLIRDFLRAEL